MTENHLCMKAFAAKELQRTGPTIVLRSSDLIDWFKKTKTEISSSFTNQALTLAELYQLRNDFYRGPR